MSMMPPTGGSRPGAPPPAEPERSNDAFAEEQRLKKEAQEAAQRAYAARATAQTRRTALLVLVVAIALVGGALWWLTPRGGSVPVPMWERRVPQGVRVIGPSIGVSPNGKWFALAWTEGTRVWWLRGSSEVGGRLRLDTPQVVADTTHPFAAFDEDPPKAAVDNAGQVAIAWMARPTTRNVGAVIAIARPDLEHDRGLAVTRIESPDTASFLLCESIAYDDDGGLVAVWMDGGRPDDAHGDSGELQCATASPQGAFDKITTLADSACTCCRTGLVWLGPEQFALTYRGVATGNVRDVHFGVLNDEGENGSGPAIVRTSQALVRNDGWVIAGCPSEGPSVAPVGSNAAYVAWYTEGAPRGLYLARLEPSRGLDGNRWRTLQAGLIDSRAEAKHPTVTTLSSGRPFVVFDGPTPEGGRALYARVERGGKLVAPMRFTTANRAERGIPVRWGRNGVLIAWQETDEFGPRVALVEWQRL